MYVAVARMHVQRDPHATAQDLFVNCVEAINDGLERFAREDVFEWCLDFAAPGHADFVRLQLTEIRFNIVEKTLPVVAYRANQLPRFAHFLCE